MECLEISRTPALGDLECPILSLPVTEAREILEARGPESVRERGAGVATDGAQREGKTFRGFAEDFEEASRRPEKPPILDGILLAIGAAAPGRFILETPCLDLTERGAVAGMLLFARD
jgi:hypothetical protein